MGGSKFAEGGRHRMDSVLYLQLAQSKLSKVSVMINKLLCSVIKGGDEYGKLLQEDKTTDLLPGEEVHMSSNRVYARSMLTNVVYLTIFFVFTFPIAIVCAIFSSTLAGAFILVFWVPAILISLVQCLAEATQTKVTVTNKRIIKAIGLGRVVSIWYEHVKRFDKVSFPDGTGVLFYTLHKSAFGKDLHITYKIENIMEVNDVFTIANSGGQV